jgi:hypothetical protein
VLEQEERPPSDERADDDDHAHRVQTLGAQPPPPGVVGRRQSTDHDPDRDRQPVPGHGDWPDLDRRVDPDRDHRCGGTVEEHHLWGHEGRGG